MSRPHGLPAIRAKAFGRLGIFALVAGLSLAAVADGDPVKAERVPALRMSPSLDLDRVSASDEDRQLLRLRGRVIDNLMVADDVMGAVTLLEQTQAQLLRRLSKPTAAADGASSAVAGDSAKSVDLADMLLPLGGALLALIAALGVYRWRPMKASASAAPIALPSLGAPPPDSLPVLDTKPATISTTIDSQPQLTT